MQPIYHVTKSSKYGMVMPAAQVNILKMTFKIEYFVTATTIENMHHDDKFWRQAMIMAILRYMIWKLHVNTQNLFQLNEQRSALQIQKPTFFLGGGVISKDEHWFSGHLSQKLQLFIKY